jgi:hypothetical protein
VRVMGAPAYSIGPKQIALLSAPGPITAITRLPFTLVPTGKTTLGHTNAPLQRILAQTKTMDRSALAMDGITHGLRCRINSILVRYTLHSACGGLLQSPPQNRELVAPQKLPVGPVLDVEPLRDTELCAAAALLPLIHRDACDRFSIAAAKRLRVPVVTIDPRFRKYGVEVLA